jgi:hypothetical protein
MKRLRRLADVDEIWIRTTGRRSGSYTPSSGEEKSAMNE